MHKSQFFSSSVIFAAWVCGLVAGEFCQCVPFWQCRDGAHDFDEDDIDFLKARNDDDTIDCGDYFNVCCKVQCGLRAADNPQTNEGSTLRPRILGRNNEALFAEYPWMLAILVNGKYRCGASLIHPQVAVTAAHCLQDLGDYTVRAGEWNWESAKEPIKHQDRPADQIIIHPKFDAASLRNDIALIIVSTAFELTPSIGIICLPPMNSYFKSPDCLATGWGKNSYKTQLYESVLKKVDLPILSRSQCQRTLQEARLGPTFLLHKSFICAGGEPNKDTCQGDGGSPLVCPIAGATGRFAQVGIVSWGLTCGLRDTPGVYVNIALFIDWIDGQMTAHNLDHRIYKY